MTSPCCPCMIWSLTLCGCFTWTQKPSSFRILLSALITWFFILMYLASSTIGSGFLDKGTNQKRNTLCNTGKDTPLNLQALNSAINSCNVSSFVAFGQLIYYQLQHLPLWPDTSKWGWCCKALKLAFYQIQNFDTKIIHKSHFTWIYGHSNSIISDLTFHLRVIKNHCGTKRILSFKQLNFSS